MLTFNHFIAEKFLMGADTAQGYTEIWVNPTRDELTKLAGNEDEIAGYVTPNNLYVWARSISEHAAIRHFLPEIDLPRMPVYLWYNHHTRKVKVRVASWSAGQQDSRLSDVQLFQKLFKHRSFKIFSEIDTSS
jgi:hypothetical protein